MVKHLKKKMAKEIKTKYLNDISKHRCYYDLEAINDSFFDYIKQKFGNKTKIHTDYGCDKNVLIFPIEKIVIKFSKVSGNKEVKNYLMARKENLQDFFAKTEEIIFYQNEEYDFKVSVYFQEYIDLDKNQGTQNFLLSKEENKTVEDFIRKTNSVSSIVLENGGSVPLIRDWNFAAHVYFNLSEEKRNLLLKFLVENKINDLHNGNFIITKNKKIIIYDYSGYDNKYSYYSSYNYSYDSFEDYSSDEDCYDSDEYCSFNFMKYYYTSDDWEGK